MKKILLWTGGIIGGGFLVIFLISLYVAITTWDERPTKAQESFNKGVEQAKNVVEGSKQVFTQQDAIKKVQEYRLSKAFPDVGVQKGDTILTYYEKRGKIPAVKNEGWSTEDKGNNTYVVGYKVTVGGMTNLPKWEVTESSIKALNGAAITLTPELQVKEAVKEIKASTNEKEIYEFSTALYKKYEQEAFAKNDTNPNENPSIQAQRLQAAEERALKETAQKYGISEKEVAAIISKLQ